MICGRPTRRPIPNCSTVFSQHFIASGFDLKDLIRTICQSSTYQLSALPNEYNLKDKQNFSRYYPKRLTAEVLYDAFHQVTETTQNYKRSPCWKHGHYRCPMRQWPRTS